MSEEENENNLGELVTRACSYSKSDTKMAGKKFIELKDLEKIPECCPKAKQWYETFNALTDTINCLGKEVSDLRRGKEVKVLSEEWKTTVDGTFAKNKFKIDLLTNVVIRQEEKIKVLEDKLQAQYHREIRPNIIIYGVLEPKEETREQLFHTVKAFLKEKLEIQDNIKLFDWYRKGKATWTNRPILIKLQHVSDKAKIFSHASNLKGKKNVRKKLFFVREEEDNQQAEMTKYYRDLLQENKQKEGEDKPTLKLTRGNIYVNSQIL